MPFKSKTKMRRYLKRWRKRHPNYMADYGRKYRALP